MKYMLIVTAAASALAMAAPAAAQYSNRTSNNVGEFSTRFDYRMDQLEDRLDSGIRAGVIDRREARDLRWQIGELTRLEDQYSRNGLSETERQDLQLRLRNLRQNLRVADNRTDGWYDRTDRYGSWDDYDNRYRGVGGPYDEDGDGIDDAYETPQRGGLGGLIDSVFGTSTLRVGQRAPGNLYAVPSDYRSSYRDGRGVYYRSDGRSIYQIDTRTNTVLQVMPMR